MLEGIDRVQLAVPSRRAAARGWQDLLGAEHDGDDRVAALGASRSTYRLGDGWLEFLEPDGAGPVADAVAARGGHLFAAGASARDVEALAGRLRERGVEPVAEAGQLHVDAGHGLRVVVSPSGRHDPVGAVDGLYEVTNLVSDAKASTEACARLFGLDAAAFVPIESSHYGYAGTLTLFDPDRLDRFEMIRPDDSGKTMSRFFGRFGESLYMAFAETGAIGEIEERAREHGAGHTPVRADGDLHTLFLHPQALGGMMLGLSRRTYAWTWSGTPDRVEPAA